MGGPIPPHTPILAPPEHRPDAPHLSLHDGLQESQDCVAGLRGPFRLQQVCNCLPERFHGMLPPAEGKR